MNDNGINNSNTPTYKVDLGDVRVEVPEVRFGTPPPPPTKK